MSALLLFTMGCYIYVPTSAGSGLPPVGKSVRVEVTESEATRLNLAEVLPDSPTTVEGELASNDDDAIEVLVRMADPPNSRLASRDMFQRIQVDRAAIVRVTQQELSRSRTIIAVGATAAIVLSALFSSLSGFVGGNTGEGQAEKP